MVGQQKSESKKSSSTSRNTVLIICGVALILIILTILAIVAFRMMQPDRSVANFCSVAKEQKPVLVSGGGNYQQRLNAYKKLEAISPDDIRSDITTIRKGYESIVQNPSNAISAGLGMSSAENHRTDYIAKNCPDF